MLLMTACSARLPTETAHDPPFAATAVYVYRNVDATNMLREAPLVAVNELPPLFEQDIAAVIYVLPDGQRIGSIYLGHGGHAVDNVAVDGRVMADLGLTHSGQPVPHEPTSVEDLSYATAPALAGAVVSR